MWLARVKEIQSSHVRRVARLKQVTGKGQQQQKKKKKEEEKRRKKKIIIKSSHVWRVANVKAKLVAV